MTEPARVLNLAVDREAALSEAVDAVRRGACVVLPTDTVYGIGADAFDRDAVQGLLDAKERGRDMPPPVLIAEPSMLRAIADEVPEGAAALAKALWPGALTLVLKAQPRSGMDLGESLGTVAVRVPDLDVARDLLRRTGPLAVSSANVSGREAGLTCDEALAQLGDRVAVYLDGGPVGGGVASTIVDFASTDKGKVLRDGAITLETLRQHAPLVDGIDAPELEPEPEVDPAVEPSPTPDPD
ncbi:tRNA threonylcarbamoyl adenosine modification protein, Sua5/YciO/YrdC/YwlC family [Tessaracoccus bendigoensis DSM 12906]|uniref:L-threonylcarbamoyladenylate synthase n=1 Tax=Tessaracoccus bendigoensis DSM 12906 TaxID=1123357 RepID=A0A1M6CTA7_9ACTN|nr:L-threonylcarbamoyladenylate synthase [Tessaracoccus bendigoensis]SHI64216.1 tRNA threonylcarbamoyl adenosine modification protein, Sua5/YciO/YrdC/YwlC family [Tessaracoccus bendigoensis DSM 12906]